MDADEKALQRAIRNRESSYRSRRRKREQLGRLQSTVESLMEELGERDAELQSIVPFVRRLLSDRPRLSRWARDLRGRPEREDCISALRAMVDHLECDSFTVKKEPPAEEAAQAPIRVEDFFVLETPSSSSDASPVQSIG